jgi:outer membrane protein assembly factor BamC
MGIVAPAVPGARIVRDGDQRWLEVNASPELAYSTIKEMWTGMGYKIEVDEPALGLVETNWSEVRPEVKEDALRNGLHRVFGAFDSNGERNKFRARIERTPGNTSIITITNKELEEVYDSPAKDSTKWQYHAPDPELEAAMLQRLALHFMPVQPFAVAVAPAALPAAGAPAAPASAPAATQPAPAVQESSINPGVHKVTAAGVVSLQVEDSLERTWRRVGIALDRGGFTVEDRRRDKGSYSVRYLDPDYEQAERERKSWWDKIFNSDAKVPEQQFQIVMSANGAITAVEIQDKDGKPDSSDTAKHILDQIMEQLR